MTIQQEYGAVQLDNYMVFMGLIPLYWDHLLTFDDELRYIWVSPLTKGSYSFFLNRYLAVLGNIPFLVIRNQTHDHAVCMIIETYHQILLVLSQIIVSCLLGIRVYALFQCQRTIAIYLVVLAIALIAVAAWSVATSESESDDIGCTAALTDSQAKRVAIAWECLLAWDFNIFCLTAWRSYKSLYFEGRRIHVPLISIMVRDGAIYFAVMVIANAANITAFFVAPGRAKGSLTTFASAISVSMMSRLMINLHKGASNLYDARPFSTRLPSRPISFSPRRGGTTDDSIESTMQ